MSNAKEVFHLREELEKSFSYCQAVKVGKTLYISGSVSWDQDGNVLGKGDFKVQIRNAYNEIKKTLEAYGAAFDNIVKETLYTTDMEALKDAAPIRAEFFKNVKPPASTWAGVTKLAQPGTLIEIEAIAELP